ncbi:MAG: hypothetical protein JWM53_1004, partial [bacterium]|nr:hypothetical protein [bacterium]
PWSRADGAAASRTGTRVSICSATSNERIGA